MANYTTKQGDQIDWICWKYYGTERKGTVEAVLEANPGLANQGTVLPAGIVIVLPDLPKPATTAQLVRLWE